jgi:O-methyltransferase
VKQARNPGSRGRFEKFMSRIADRAATASGRLLYKRGVRFLGDPEWRAPYELELAADERPGKPPNRALDRRFIVVQLAESVRGMEGSTAECGAFRGVGSALICRALDGTYGQEDGHFAFDAFEGLPEPVAADRAESGQWWSEGDLKTDRGRVEKLLTPFPFARIEVGWIPERFPEVEDLKFRLVHVDVDLYEPTRDSIEFFFPRLVPGGVLLLDDHGVMSCPGARKAAVEYFAKSGDPIVELPSGQAIVWKRA